MQIASFLVLRRLLVRDDFLLLHQEVEHSVHDGPIDPEDLRGFVSLDDALLDRFADDGFLDDHVLLVVDVEAAAEVLLLLGQVR
jgi:hypothetical protein